MFFLRVLGICHQVNLEYLAQVVTAKDGVIVSGHTGWNRFSYSNGQWDRGNGLGSRRH